MCGRTLRVLLLVLFLLSLLSVPIYSDVVLTDQEYNELLTALTEAKNELNEQKKTIEEQQKRIKQLGKRLSESTSLTERQRQRIDQLGRELEMLSESLKQQKRGEIRSNLTWGGIGAVAGFMAAGLTFAVMR